MALFPIEAQEPGQRLPGIGLIVNTIAEALREDWEGTLRTVAALGYTELEFRGFYGVSRSRFRSFLEEIGLKAVASGHILDELKKKEVLEELAGDSHALGKEYIICYKPWMEKVLKAADDFRYLAEELNELGLRCRELGLRFAYHNHDTELARVDDAATGYDLLLQQTDPELVSLQLDLYWAAKGGADPVTLLHQHPARFALLHVKDMDHTPIRGFTCPGKGLLPFKELFRAAHTAGVKHYIVEVERSANPMGTVRDAIAYLKGLRF